ncbi:hypothetical protein [Aquabacterium sp. J223]|uniref:hypothetical protein n=1 Tax=Aquabacterium sp. J223 TaxID=2898431 RepID=UPI0021ADF65A|nr:hypothetical protein [Aquabacterium sp. J223]UUX95549.1 hypothetical protein LRS07_20485 [Aquabacterium sp. J223]
MTLTPSPLTAALAGAFSALVMPVLWPRLVDDSLWLVLGFLLVVAFPAHAFVLGLGQAPSARPGTLDKALLKRVGAWGLAAALVLLVTWGLRA